MLRSKFARRWVAVGVVMAGLAGGHAAAGQTLADTRHAVAILGAWRAATPGERLALLGNMLDDRATTTAALQAAVVAGDAQTRAAACALLGELRDRTALPALLAATRDPEDSVQAQAVSALRNLRDPAAAPRLRALVRGPADRGIRKRAMVALAGVGTASDRAVVRPLLSDPDETVRTIAAGSLAMLGSAEAEDVLLAAVDGDNPAAQKNATYALGFLGTATARARLEEILADPAGRWKSYAIMAIAESDAMSQPPSARASALEQLARGSDRIVVHWALDRLSESAGPEADAALQRLSSRPGKPGQRAAVRLRTREGR